MSGFNILELRDALQRAVKAQEAINKIISTPINEENRTVSYAIAYERCPQAGNEKSTYGRKNVSQMSATFQAWKQTMKNGNDDENDGHFIKISSTETDPDSGAAVKVFESYEHDCVHTRP